MLLLLSSSLPREVTYYRVTIRQAQDYLARIKGLSEPPTPLKGSAALETFDPIIARRLISIMPPKIVEFPQYQQTWEQYSLFVDGLREAGLFSTCPSFGGIQVRGFAPIGLILYVDLRKYSTCAPRNRRDRADGRLFVHSRMCVNLDHYLLHTDLN